MKRRSFLRGLLGLPAIAVGGVVALKAAEPIKPPHRNPTFTGHHNASTMTTPLKAVEEDPAFPRDFMDSDPRLFNDKGNTTTYNTNEVVTIEWTHLGDDAWTGRMK